MPKAPQVVESNCHAAVGGHAAQWTIHDNGDWHATYGPHSEQGSAEGLDEARAAAEAWVGTLHKALTGAPLA